MPIKKSSQSEILAKKILHQIDVSGILDFQELTSIIESEFGNHLSRLEKSITEIRTYINKHQLHFNNLDAILNKSNFKRKDG
jgi:hypothetical protein